MTWLKVYIKRPPNTLHHCPFWAIALDAGHLLLRMTALLIKLKLEDDSYFIVKPFTPAGAL
jgi:mannosyltransferase OCH1-like enzyme